jgi:hypothetical protein
MSAAAPLSSLLQTDLRRADLRASDAEREATVARLHQALGDGFLDLDETDQRVAAAYAARHLSELEPLTADIPRRPGSGTTAPAWSDVWISAVWRSRVTLLGDAPEKPTARQCRTAAVLAVLVVLWLVVCFVLGAVL